jgi:hypothetical protein
MISKFSLAIIFILISGALLAGTAKGTLVIDEKTYNINTVQAKTDQNPFDETKKDFLLLFTDQPVEEGMFDLNELDSLAEAGTVHGILIRIDDQKEPTGLIVLGVVQRSGNSICNFDATAFDVTHVAGKVYLANPDESFGRKYTFEIEFDTSVKENSGSQVVKITGTPLPTDGGEPFKTYQEYEKAIQSGNPQMLKKFLVPEQATRLDDPEAAKMLGLMKMMRAQEVKFVQGSVEGERATLTLEGKDPLSGGKTNGSIRMIQVQGKWLLEKENWTGSLQ